MQNKKKTKYTLNVDDSRKSNTKNRTKVNKRIIIVGVIVVIAALLILKMYFLDELKNDKKISSGIEKITGDSGNKAKDDNSKPDTGKDDNSSQKPTTDKKDDANNKTNNVTTTVVKNTTQKSTKTGDQTPVELLTMGCLVSLLAIIILKKKKVF